MLKVQLSLKNLENSLLLCVTLLHIQSNFYVLPTEEEMTKRGTGQDVQSQLLFMLHVKKK